MIRFVDLRDAEIPGYRFAFWDTVRDRFLEFGDDQAWDTWSDFEEACAPEEAERWKPLLPKWVREEPPVDFDRSADAARAIMARRSTAMAFAIEATRSASSSDGLIGLADRIDSWLSGATMGEG